MPDLKYVLLAHGWWFSPGIPASSITKTGRHDIASTLLKVALNTKKSIILIDKNINLQTINHQLDKMMSRPMNGRLILTNKRRASVYVRTFSSINCNGQLLSNLQICFSWKERGMNLRSVLWGILHLIHALQRPQSLHPTTLLYAFLL